MFYLFNKIFSNFSQIERRALIGAALIFIVSLFFISVNSYYKNTVELPVRGGSYVEGLVGQPSFINPLISNMSDVDRDLIAITYSSLDDLVDKYQISEDNRSWTLILKKDLVWSDGQSLTADDIAFTVETIQDANNNHPLYSTWRGVVVERLNENEIRFTLKTPYVFLIDNFKELKIAPKHIFGNIPTANLRLSRYNLEPISSGPYKFGKMEIRRDGFITHYRLTSNELYHDQLPYIENFAFRFYNNDSDLIKGFNRKEVDGIGALNQNHLKYIRVGHKIITINLPRYYAIFLNSNTTPALQSLSVRKALDLAINKEKIVKKIFDDQTTIIQGPLPPNIRGYDQQLFADKKFNLKKAAQLLDDAGWTVGEENVRIRDNKKEQLRLEFDVIVPEIPFLIKTVELIKEDWARIGVKLNPIVLNTNDISNNVIKTRNYQMLVFGNILKKNPDIFSFWHSSERFYPGRNLALYENRQVDRLLSSIRQDFSNHSRNKKLSQLQQIINDDKPAIFLYSPNYLYITPKNLKGFYSYFIATPAQRFEKINQWHLRTYRKFQ